MEPMTLTLSLAGLLAPIIGGGAVWAVRQEGRINTHDEILRAIKELTMERHQEIKADLKRLDEKVEYLSDFMIRQATKRPNGDERPR